MAELAPSAGIFLLFTGMLLVSHTHLIWVGQTTVESMQLHALQEQESRALSDALGCCQILYALPIFPLAYMSY
jgi:hypothetical protein